jgi:hypothetical protein
MVDDDYDGGDDSDSNNGTDNGDHDYGDESGHINCRLSPYAWEFCKRISLPNSEQSYQIQVVKLKLTRTEGLVSAWLSEATGLEDVDRRIQTD